MLLLQVLNLQVSFIQIDNNLNSGGNTIMIMKNLIRGMQTIGQMRSVIGE